MASPVFPPCSAPRSAVFGRFINPRIIEADDRTQIKRMHEITREQVKENSVLSLLIAEDPLYILAQHGGFPVLVRGVGDYGDSTRIVFSPGLEYFARIGSARVAGNNIKFNHGGEQRTEERGRCWEYAVKREKIEVLTEEIRRPSEIPPLVLARPGETDCPICRDALTGANVSCSNKHQTCVDCYRLLNPKICPICRTGFPASQVEIIENIIGGLVERTDSIRSQIDGGNSYKIFKNTEAHFMGVLRYVYNTGHFTLFQRMVISSYYNYILNQKEPFGCYDEASMIQYDGNCRRIKLDDQLASGFLEYLEKIDQPIIYNDVAHTEHYSIPWTITEFYHHLEEIEGGSINRIKDYSEGGLIILKREIYFRTCVNQIPAGELKSIFKGIFEKMFSILKSHKTIALHTIAVAYVEA
jgi:hypothetical protein